MDLEAYTTIGTGSSHWANLTALLCFALSCGLLMGSLSMTFKEHAAGAPAAVEDLRAPAD